jgi:hypothetical protein
MVMAECVLVDVQGSCVDNENAGGVRGACFLRADPKTHVCFGLCTVRHWCHQPLTSHSRWTVP